MNLHTKVKRTLTKQDIYIQSKYSHVDKNDNKVSRDMKVKIQWFY
jgi:hypothetical protein